MLPDHSDLNAEIYQCIYKQSIEDPTHFWAEAARFITWYQPWQSVQKCDFKTGQIAWFTEAKLNVCHNCVDRHLPTRASQPAIFWEGDNSTRRQVITYQMLYQRVCRFANSLKTLGIKKGDRICIYLPMIPDAFVAMLACARIGAIHTVVFGGFSPRALAERISNADCKIVITVDEGLRGGKVLPAKKKCR